MVTRGWMQPEVYTYVRKDKITGLVIWSIKCIVDHTGFVSFSSPIFPAEASAVMKEHFMAEAERAAEVAFEDEKAS